MLIGWDRRTGSSAGMIMPDIIAAIENVCFGYAYSIDGDVYYRAFFPDYGKLSAFSDNMLAGARIEDERKQSQAILP